VYTTLIEPAFFHVARRRHLVGWGKVLSQNPKPFNYGDALARRACAALSLLTFSTLARVCAVFILFKNRSLLARFFLVRFKQIFLPRNRNNKQGL
jgi:hypothetical protein